MNNKDSYPNYSPSGTYQLLSKGNTIPRRGNIKVRIGKALNFKVGTKYEDATQIIEKATKSLVTEK